MILYPFIGLAALGLGLSLLAHFAALLGFDVPASTMGLHIGIFVVWLPTVLVANATTKDFPRKDYWAAALRGCPTWMKYMVNAFFAYGLLNFALFILSAPGRGAAASTVIRGFSGHWMIFYSTALAVMYSATQIWKNDQT